MSWVRIDDQYSDHPKIVEVGPLGMALHLAATCYCAKYLTDGFVSAGIVKRLIDFDGISITSNGVSNAVTNELVTNQLVKAGLFDKVEGGYMVHDYLKYNPSSDQVKAEREESARRQAAWREKNRDKTGKYVSNAVTNGVSNASCYTAPTPSPTPLIKDDDDESTQLNQKMLDTYQNEIGLPTRDTVELLVSAQKDYTAEWVIDAILVASRNNARKWSYVETVLRNWKRDGKDAKPPGWNNGYSGGNGHQPALSKQERVYKAAHDLAEKYRLEEEEDNAKLR